MSGQRFQHTQTTKISKQNSVIFIKWSDILGKNAIFTKESVIFMQNSVLSFLSTFPYLYKLLSSLLN